MRLHKKAAAFIAALLMCALSMAPAATVFADEPETTTASAEETTEETTEAENDDGDEDEELITSGDFTYRIAEKGKISIEKCTSDADSIEIPGEIDGLIVTELGKTALGSDPKACNFESVTLPASLEYISENNPFLYCEKLKEIKIDPANKDFVVEGNVLYTADKEKLICYPQRRSDTSFTVPDGVKELGNSSIYNTELTEVKLPASLETVGLFALSYNIKLKEIDMSHTAVTYIDQMAFTGDNTLETVKFSECLLEIDGGAFWNCKLLKDVELPDKLTYIGQNAFMDTAMEKIIVPGSVTEIGYCALGYKKTLSGTDSAVSGFLIIGEYGSAAHKYCTDTDTEMDYKNEFDFITIDEYTLNSELNALSKVNCGDYVYAVVGENAVIVECKSEERSIDVPSELDGYKVKAIYPRAFTQIKAEEIRVAEGIEKIREISFYACDNLKLLVLPSSLKEIGRNAFDSCENLEDINLGGAVSVGEDAFYGCLNLKKITFCGDYDYKTEDAVFTECLGLEEFVISREGSKCCARDGVLFTADGKQLLAYPPARPGKVYKVPKDVEKIGDFAFLGASVVEEVILPKKLQELGSYTFYSCDSLKSIRAYERLNVIGEDSFGFTINDQAQSEEDSPSKVVESFKLYAPKGSKAYEYAETNGIKVVSGTVRIFGSNVRILMLGTLGGFIAVGAAALGISLKSRSKKKSDVKSASSNKKSVKENGDES